MICPNCGKEIRDGLTFCPSCAKEIAEKVEIQPTQIEQPQNNQIEIEVDTEIPIGNGMDSVTPAAERCSYDNRKKRVYEKTWFIIVLLIFFWPAGLFLMWKYTNWNKIVKIVITVLCALSLITALTSNKDDSSADKDIAIEKASDSQTAEASEQEGAEIKHPIKMVDGFDKLQSLYLQIDDTYTREQIKELAEENGFFVNEQQPWHYVIYISEKENTGYTNGAEPAPTYDVDYLRISCFEDEKINDNIYYAFSKDYITADDKKVEYTFYNTELEPNGENGDWTIEEALKTVAGE